MAMDFDDLLSQVLVLLQREKRVSYRAIKLRFSIDDDYIEGLKDELIYAKKLAVDEDDRVLVWTGETGEIQITPSQPAKPESPPVIEQVQPVQATQPIVSHTPEAERRQLTVMFVDLVGSTNLSGELDPEDYREVVRQYQQVCSEVISRFDGYIAQYLGDGLLVYFGYPVAHEDDAQRAIHSGLGIVKAIDELNSRLEQDKGVKLAVRLGIHTGLVVVGEMGGEGRQEQLALGEVPNIASRLEGLAAPNTVVLSAATYRLIEGYFECESMGEQILRGLTDPIAVYRVLSESGVQSHLDVAGTRGLTPLVGRESESTLLFERWAQAKDGNGQVVLLSGEAGIGKSRLVQVLKDHVTEGTHTRLECRSLPYFTNSALYPITNFLQQTLRFQSDDTPEQKLEKLEQNLSQYRLPLEETVPLFGTLLSLPVPEDHYPPLSWTPQHQRQKTLEAIVAIILELSERQPVLFILEELHWTDPTTLELLELLIDQTPTASLYVLVTCRPEFQPSWSHRSYLTEMTINRLSQDQVEQIATQVAGGKTLPAEVIGQLVERTDGVPLYVEEMTKAILESGSLKAVDGRYELTGDSVSLAIPATLQDSLMSRLDRLVTAKAVAQYAAVIGRQFSYELLQAVSELDEATLQRELGRLVDAELVYQRGVVPGATYIFKHALIQDTAYESLLRSTRQGYHRRIAEVLEAQFPETAETQLELLAHHYTEAGLHEQAVGYWHRSGERSRQHSANAEAITYFNKGLQLLTSLPETAECSQQELKLQIALAGTIHLTKQAIPELERIWTRALDLCQQVGDTPQFIQVLTGLSSFYRGRGQHRKAKEIADQLFVLAQTEGDANLLMRVYNVVGVGAFYLGDLLATYETMEQMISFTDRQEWSSFDSVLSGSHPGVGARAWTAWILWYLGYPDQARMRSREACDLAQERDDPNSLIWAFNLGTRVYQYCAEIDVLQEQADALITLATEHEIPIRVATGTFMHGCALVDMGQTTEGIAQMHKGLEIWQASAEGNQTYFLVRLADAYRKSEKPEDGLRLLDDALEIVKKNEEGFCEAEIYQIQGDLLLQQSSSNEEQAENRFKQAVAIAQRQRARSLELRAATSLARLWQSQGKRQKAYDLLAPVYGWFTEGFDTADLIDAKELLDELEGGQ